MTRKKQHGIIDPELEWSLSDTINAVRLPEALRKALVRIRSGEEPNEVFGWKRKPGKEPDINAKWARFEAGCCVLYLNRERDVPINDNSAKEGAISQVARSTELSEREVRKGYEAVARDVNQHSTLYPKLRNVAENFYSPDSTAELGV